MVPELCLVFCDEELDAVGVGRPRIALEDGRAALGRADLEAGHIKFWLLPEVRGMIGAGRINFLPATTVREIRSDVTILDPGGIEVEADFVVLLTGYEQDASLFQSAGVELEGADDTPYADAQYERLAQLAPAPLLVRRALERPAHVVGLPFRHRPGASSGVTPNSGCASSGTSATSYGPASPMSPAVGTGA